MVREQRDFAEFYALAKDDCLRAVLACTGDRPAAEDLVAEAFARAWASWHKVGTHPAPRAWVVKTALNTRVSVWRRHRREVALDHADAAAAAVQPDDGLVDAKLMAVLLRLPLRQRQVVALRIFLDLDTAHTARLLGIAPGTVTAHMARAVVALRQEFTPAPETETR
jgi:RNA polymerase sigma factor (sigma-70 family)